MVSDASSVHSPIYCMKQVSSLLICVLLLTSCAAESVSGYNSGNDQIFGKWKLKNYADGRAVPFEVTIEFKNETDSLGKYIISGKSPLNVYYSTFELQRNSRSINLFDIQITKIDGTPEVLLFENRYFETLSKVARYEISEDGKVLTLLLPESEKQHITYTFEP